LELEELDQIFAALAAMVAVAAVAADYHTSIVFQLLQETRML
jgi:hypothetical protein